MGSLVFLGLVGHLEFLDTQVNLASQDIQDQESQDSLVIQALVGSLDLVVNQGLVATLVFQGILVFLGSLA